METTILARRLAGMMCDSLYTFYVWVRPFGNDGRICLVPNYQDLYNELMSHENTYIFCYVSDSDLGTAIFIG